jgi:hypothetical protein
MYGGASYADFLNREEIHPLIFNFLFFVFFVFYRNQVKLLLKNYFKYNAQQK